ncbi:MULTISPECIES: dephospho-CoA kinase [unclassified Mucilaginibacter]|uniref:dephospho-CoA kinase n=1 Tax=unclassified Mucilaginibacter TaxID=2617802 RepID=UPI002AC8FF53|nr:MULTISPECIES: dephospho-CoA kinase [unclassified Mucilaginibacter]MEB0263656.1 dephospho-CoA kinase [Mucilaginibacter sp. 10I4]MEB0277890.1 dephospho-CoA kinase [Mucilaginibacter sp. 10B2]MEB0300563.1 dephospho-CoA kinase [Mucilaginibacter sp. 5C4]WPX22781.1 dephospho-CoA kinase [Mucilaginibacter sp. 5C4]
MFKVGITGNIGSGKTTVCKIFEVLGIPVFYADDAAKDVMVTDAELIAGIKQTFGNEAYFEDGMLNRKHIAGIVFNDKEQLAKLNALVHPAVFRAFDKWVLNQKEAPYVLKEAAILFESGSYKKCDRAIMVTAPLELRIKRVTQRNGITADEVKARNDRQFTEEKKLALANDVIKNDDTQLVIPQVLKLHQLYLSIAQKNS